MNTFDNITGDLNASPVYDMYDCFENCIYRYRPIYINLQAFGLDEEDVNPEDVIEKYNRRSIYYQNRN